MKTLRQMHYCTVAVLVTLLLEGLMTFGSAFNFENYNWFAWFVQACIFAFAITTALRLADEMSKEGL
jgi:hypothetical protein